jgi:hypothetical protein
MASKRNLSHEEQLEAAVAAARARLQSKGTATGTQLGSPAVRPQVVQRLCSEGYEPTAKGLRVGLQVQCDKLLADGKPMSLPDFKKRLEGATANEAKELPEQLRRAGKGHVVLRGKQPYLVPRAEPVLSRNALKEMVDRLKATTAKLKATMAWLEKARRDKTEITVLESDLSTELAALTALLGKPGGKGEAALPIAATAHPKTTTKPLSDTEASVPLRLALRGAILALRDEDSHLANVPNVSRRLRERASAKDVIDVLLSEFQRGKLELRPEGGFGRLSQEDSALCPVGAGGAPLSWVLLREE